jgi:hypothetical protein
MPAMLLTGRQCGAAALAAETPQVARHHVMQQASDGRFKPPATRAEVKDEFGIRVRLAVIAGAGRALVPEAPPTVVDAIAAWEKTLPAPAR